MDRLSLGIVLGTATAVLLAVVTPSRAENVLKADLHPSGMIEISRDGVHLAMIELNAHGAAWQHAPQKGATAEVTDLPAESGKQVVGVLGIPNTDGGAIRYTQTVTVVPQGLRLAYDLTMTKTVRMNGLQFSINLDVPRYAGTEVVVYPAYGEPELVGLPKEEQENRFQLWSGQGARIEVAKGTEKAITLELLADADTVIQDMRRWDNPVYEIRFPAIMEDPPREVSAGDTFHLQLTVTFAGPIRLGEP